MMISKCLNTKDIKDIISSTDKLFTNLNDNNIEPQHQISYDTHPASIQRSENTSFELMW